MDSAEVLQIAAAAARHGQLRITGHARDRMPQRNATLEDIETAVCSATAAKHDPEKGTWKLTGGADIDGDSLDVCVAIEGNVVRVVTLF